MKNLNLKLLLSLILGCFSISISIFMWNLSVDYWLLILVGGVCLVLYWILTSIRNPHLKEKHLSRGLSMVKIDFKKGKEVCAKNALNHLEISELLINNNKYGAAITHSILAVEEAAKAVYVSMVDANLIESTDIESIFRLHQPKALLFDEWFENGVRIVCEGKKRKIIVQNKELNNDVLESLFKLHKKTIKKHNKSRNKGLYVNLKMRSGIWLSPQEISLTEAEQMCDKYKTRTLALISASDILSGLKPMFTEINNFKFYKRVTENEISYTFQYDEI